MGRVPSRENYEDPWLSLLASAGEMVKAWSGREFFDNFPDSHPNFDELFGRWIAKADYRKIRLYHYRTKYLEALKSDSPHDLVMAKSEITKAFTEYYSIHFQILNAISGPAWILLPIPPEEVGQYRQLHEDGLFDTEEPTANHRPNTAYESDYDDYWKENN